MSSKEKQKSFLHGLGVLFAALLTFGGPTYLVYVLEKLDVPKILSLPLGLTAFAVGVILFAHLLKGERKIEAST